MSMVRPRAMPAKFKKVPKKRKPMRKVSKKHAAELRIYAKLRAQFLADHPWCQYEELSEFRGQPFPMPCWQESTQVHHKKLRGKHLLDVDTYLATCDVHGGTYIHDRPADSYARGFLIRP